MIASQEGDWLKEYVWAVAALTASCLVAFAVGEASLLLIPAAFVIGLLLRPRLIWPLWLWTLVVIWVGNGITALVDPEWWSDSGETFVSFFFESLLFMTVLVLLPLWIGRLVARALGRRHAV